MIETDNISNLIKEAKDYLDAKVELAKLQAAESLSEGIALAVAQLIIGALLILFLFFFSIFIAIYLGSLLDSYWYGFGIICGFYLFILLIFAGFKKHLLKNPIQNSVIKHFFKESVDD